MSNPDDFSDVRHQLSGFGMLGGAGAEEHYSARTKMQPDGMAFHVYCDRCGATNDLIISWDEFIYGMNRAMPPGWTHDRRHGGLVPNAGCYNCRDHLMVQLTPDECQRHLKAGEQANHVTRGRIQQLSQQIQQQMAGYRK